MHAFPKNTRRRRGNGRPARSPDLVPYVVPWDSEHVGGVSALTTEHHGGYSRLAYKAPRESDRDGAEVLWTRHTQSRGVGNPKFAAMHSERQFECMYALKCQVCAEPASRNKDGYLFLSWPEDQPHPENRSPGWPEGALTTQPPLCEAHARTAARLCPHAPHFVALRVGLPKLWGVLGTAYPRTVGGWVIDNTIPELRFGDPRLRHVLASHLVRQLRKVKIVELP